MSAVQDSAVSVSRDDAVKFLQTAARNWEHLGPLSRDDFDDVAGALQSFYLARATTLREQRDELLEALEGLRGILNTAESNASGNLGWEAVSSRVNAARAAITKVRGVA